MIRDFNKSSKRKRKYVHIHFKHLEESKVALYPEDDMIIKIIMASRAAGRQGDQHCMLLPILIFAGLRLPSRPRRKQFIPHPPLLPVKPSAVNFLVSLQILEFTVATWVDRAGYGIGPTVALLELHLAEPACRARMKHKTRSLSMSPNSKCQ